MRCRATASDSSRRVSTITSRSPSSTRPFSSRRSPACWAKTPDVTAETATPEHGARARRRVAIYLSVGLAVTLGGVLVAGAPFRLSAETHTLLELATFALALFAGILALVR